MTTPMGTKFYLRPGVGFTWRAPGEERYALPEGARLLVVIDPKDSESIMRLQDALHAQRVIRTDSTHEALVTALREFANPTPPKPEEPTGLGAVVEDDEGGKWVRSYHVTKETHPWQNAFSGRRTYGGIRAVKVLSEGVVE